MFLWTVSAYVSVCVSACVSAYVSAYMCLRVCLRVCPCMCFYIVLVHDFLGILFMIDEIMFLTVSPCKSTSDYPGLEKHFRRCFPTYSSATEYTTEYNMPGWVPVDNRSVFHSTFDLKRACPKPWRYRTERELNTLPYRGRTLITI